MKIPIAILLSAIIIGAVLVVTSLTSRYQLIKTTTGGWTVTEALIFDTRMDSTTPCAFDDEDAYALRCLVPK